MIFKDEKELFDSVRKHLLPDLETTANNFSFDAFSPESNIFLEFKCRTAHYDQLMVEQNKWFNMLRDMDKFEAKGFYVCATPKGVFSFDIRDIHTYNRPKFMDKRLNKTTMYGGGTVTKKIAYLDISISRNIEASIIGF